MVWNNVIVIVELKIEKLEIRKDNLILLLNL